MNRLKTLIVATVLSLGAQGLFAQGFVPPVAETTDKQDDFGLWFEVGATKKMNNWWSASLEAEMRTADNVHNVSSARVGLFIGYKPLKWLKFNAGYQWQYNHTTAKISYHYSDDMVCDGLNVTKGYWQQRNRFIGEIGLSTPRMFGCLKLSVRGRYQYQLTDAMNLDRDKYRVYTSDGPVLATGATYKTGDLRPGYPQSDPKLKHESSSQTLRTRVKLEMNKKRCQWSPFVSYEFFNRIDKDLTFDKGRLSVGTGYDISKHHSLSLAYLLNWEYDEMAIRTHIVSVGYNFNF